MLRRTAQTTLPDRLRFCAEEREAWNRKAFPKVPPRPAQFPRSWRRAANADHTVVDADIVHQSSPTRLRGQLRWLPESHLTKGQLALLDPSLATNRAKSLRPVPWRESLEWTLVIQSCRHSKQ